MRPTPRVHFREKNRCVCISVTKAPPILVSIDSAFVLQGKGKQLDDIMMGINTMTAIIWALPLYQSLH